MARAKSIDMAALQECITKIRRLPQQVADFTAPLTPAQLTTQFLAGEWSVAQNVHHLADSHMNSYIRLKLILTEENPTIRPYDQDAWAMTQEANSPDLHASLTLLRGLHQRWADLFDGLTADEWQRTGRHPESGVITPGTLAKDYAEHGEGHLDQMQRTLAAQPK
jgi:DinB superfamily